MTDYPMTLIHDYGYLVVLNQSDKNTPHLELEAILPKTVCEDFYVNDSLISYRNFMDKINEAYYSFELSEMDAFWLDAYKRQLRCYVITLY